MKFITFTATSAKIQVVVENTIQPTKVTFLLADGVTTVDVATPTDITGLNHTYELAGDYSNGIYTCTVNPGESDELVSFIGNLLKGMNCLLQKTLNEEYDCRLLQEMEATQQFIFLQEEYYARGTYDEVERKCTQCSSTYVEGLAGISIWIVNNDFIVQ